MCPIKNSWRLPRKEERREVQAKVHNDHAYARTTSYDLVYLPLEFVRDRSIAASSGKHMWALLNK
ncbi:Lipase_3 domain-containing protein [Psidium guajava]|nr:Lipase_3 domain-containing protein [Psidium guajava]